MSTVALEYTQNIYAKSNNNNNTSKTDESNETSTKDVTSSTRTKKVVSFDSSIFLDDLFKKAIKYAMYQSNKKEKLMIKSCEIYVGIDIVSYGASNAKMSYVLKRIDNSNKTSIDLVEDHIGNLKLMPNYTKTDIEFIDEFQLIIKTAFQCFGKRWYELSEYDVNSHKSEVFNVVEIDQYPYISFDDAKYYSIDKLVAKFFESMLKCISPDLIKSPERLNKVCISIPNDFHTYQRLVLKNSLDNIGVKNFLITTKATALAMPFLAKDREDKTKKLILDFGSGYLNCSILQMQDDESVKQLDYLADRNISAKKFFENCFRHVKKKAKNYNKLSSKKIIYSQIKNNLYKVMNQNRVIDEERDQLDEVWPVMVEGLRIDMNMTDLGAKELADQIVQKLLKTHLIDRKDLLINSEIRDILVCSDAILFEYLEPILLKYCHQTTGIVFMDLDCATLGGSFLASTDIKTSDMLPFPIGMSMYNGVIKPLIRSKKNYPCSGKYLFQTIVDNQKIIRVNIYEGFSPLARSCKQICEIKIENLLNNAIGRNKIELVIQLDVNGLLNAYAEDKLTKERLDLTISFDALSFVDFERDADEKPVNINRSLDKEIFYGEIGVAKFLDDLDYYLEYLLNIYRFSPERLRLFILGKVLQAKKYISVNRFKISYSECDQLASELEEIVNANRPIDENHKELKMVHSNYNTSGLCNLI